MREDSLESAALRWAHFVKEDFRDGLFEPARQALKAVREFQLDGHVLRLSQIVVISDISDIA